MSLRGYFTVGLGLTNFDNPNYQRQTALPPSRRNGGGRETCPFTGIILDGTQEAKDARDAVLEEQTAAMRARQRQKDILAGIESRERQLRKLSGR